MRITRKMLESRVHRLNIVLNRPIEGWTRDEKRHAIRSTEGHFLLDSNSPGDGWTRYTLSCIVGENGGQTNVSPTCTAQEMWTYLREVFDVLDSEYSHNFDKMHGAKPDYCECGRIRSACTGGYAKNQNTLHTDKTPEFSTKLENARNGVQS
jgi:hypothetical protein